MPNSSLFAALARRSGVETPETPCIAQVSPAGVRQNVKSFQKLGISETPFTPETPPASDARDDEYLRAAFDERAGFLEFDFYLSRSEAERIAAYEIYGAVFTKS